MLGIKPGVKSWLSHSPIPIFNFSDLQLFHIQNGSNNYFIGFLWELNEWENAWSIAEPHKMWVPFIIIFPVIAQKIINTWSIWIPFIILHPLIKAHALNYLTSLWRTFWVGKKSTFKQNLSLQLWLFWLPKEIIP